MVYIYNIYTYGPHQRSFDRRRFGAYIRAVQTHTSFQPVKGNRIIIYMILLYNNYMIVAW